MMQSDLAFYLVAGVLLILWVLLVRWTWRGGKTAPAATKPPRVKRNPKPFVGLTRQPLCGACEQGAGFHPPAPGAPPPRIILTRGRRRHVDTPGISARMPPVRTTAPAMAAGLTDRVWSLRDVLMYRVPPWLQT